MKNLSKKIVIGNLSDKIDPDSGTEVCWCLLWRKEMKKFVRLWMTDLDWQTDGHNAHSFYRLKGWWIRLPYSQLARKWIHLLPNHSDTYLEGVLKQIWSGIQIKDRRSRLQILNQLQFWFQNTSTSDWGWPSARTCSRSPSCKADMATDTFRKWAPGRSRPRARTIRLWLEDLVSLSRVFFLLSSQSECTNTEQI